MIPKKIHYCWFGSTKPDYVLKCIETWKLHLPDYEIIEWNDDSLTQFNSKFIESALEKKKYAFVSDYVRAYALFSCGGIYLDTDVEVKESFDRFLDCQAFSGFEAPSWPFTAVWGSIKGHIWPMLVLKFYADKVYEDGFSTNTVIISKLLEAEFGINKNIDSLQVGRNGVIIYPSHYFCLDLPKNYATHHFQGSWLKSKSSISYKDYLRNEYYKSNINSSLVSRADILLMLSSHSINLGFLDKLKILVRIFLIFYGKKLTANR